MRQIISLSQLLCRTLLITAGFFCASAAYAECGGSVQCIAVGATAANARIAHHGGGAPDTPTLTFANQAAATTSASQTIFVAAVTGPVGAMAMLGNITISGPNAADFLITGGTCSPANGPTHDAAAGGGTLCTITVAFRPVTGGAKTATVNVPLNPPCVGCITGRTVTLAGTGIASVGGPTAGAAAMTVPVNTATTLDFLPFTSGGATGVAVVSAPAHGTVTVNGTVVTYTPARDYFGADAFTYAAFNGAGSSTAAAVTVSVSGRPDPSLNPVVRGLLRSQADTAKRFARSQISNLQRRMESLHLGSSSGSTIATAGTGAGLSETISPANGFAARDPFAVAGWAPRIRAGVADVGGSQGLGLLARGTPEFGTRRDASAVSPLLPASFITSLAGAANTGSLNLSASGRADGIAPAGTGVWLGGSLNFGTRDQTGDSNGLRFTTDGLTVGMDHRFSDTLAMGVGVGYARDKTQIGIDGSSNKAHGASIAFYGSYQPARNVFVDGMLGYGSLNYDSQRFVAAAADYARAKRKGDQWFGSIAAGYEHRADGLLLSPYGRIDFDIDRLKRATEIGAGLNALTYHDQTLRSTNLSLGLRAETAHQTNFGWAVPRLRVEFTHGIEGDRAATLSYADQLAGPLYGVPGLTGNRNSVLLGFGSDFILRDGLKLGFDYQTLRSFGPDHSHSLRFWISKELDGKGLPTGLVASKLFSDPLRVEAGMMWDDNLNRARDASEKLSDRIYSINVGTGMTFPLTDHARVVASGFLSGDKLQTYSGLDRFSGGVQGEWQYRTSGEFDAVTFGLFGRASIDEYNSSLRSGRRYSLGINARQALTDRIDIFGALVRNYREARNNTVFDGRDYSVRFNLDYDLGQSGSLYLGGEYRRGDTVTSAPTSLYYNAQAKVSTTDDVYGTAAWSAYRYEARTTIWTLGYNYPLGPRDSIDFSWRYARSTPTGQVNSTLYGGVGATYGGSATYSANQYSIAYLMRF